MLAQGYFMCWEWWYLGVGNIIGEPVTCWGWCVPIHDS